MISSARQIQERVDSVRVSAKSEPENLGHRVCSCQSSVYVEKS